MEAAGFVCSWATQSGRKWHEVPRKSRRLRTQPCMAVRMTPALQKYLTEWGVKMQLDGEFASAKLIHESPPVFMLPNFVEDKRCRLLIKYAQELRSQRKDTAESDLYLNYRVNKEQREGGTSAEAHGLISREQLRNTDLHAGQKSGFRLKVDETLVRPLLPQLQRFMGLSDREVVFEEGIWHKPNSLTMYIRDQTIVHYEKDEGVAPHVDGKDATLLVYLNDVEENSGGRTVFPEIGLAVPPSKGTALLYESNKGLLHFAESVKSGEKWIMQLLIDFKYDASQPTIDYRTGRVIG